MKNPDVIVLGAGPAGTSGAIVCARAGLSVALVEVEPFPRHRPGETLHPGVEPLLERLGVAARVRGAGFLRHEGLWIERPQGTEFYRYGSDHRGTWWGFQAWRADFDALLLEEAHALGVAVYHPHRALEPIRWRNRIIGAETTAGTFRATWTLDATGQAAWLSRKLSLGPSRMSTPLIAHYGYMEGECPRRDSAPQFARVDGGWLWTARVKSRLYHWTRLAEAGTRVHRAWIPEEFSMLKPVGTMKGADVTWRRVDACAGPGYFILGDAAAVLDPSSSHGVLRAIMSGMLAGHLACAEILHGAPQSAVALHYRQTMATWFSVDAASLQQSISTNQHSQRTHSAVVSCAPEVLSRVYPGKSAAIPNDGVR